MICSNNDLGTSWCLVRGVSFQTVCSHWVRREAVSFGAASVAMNKAKQIGLKTLSLILGARFYERLHLRIRQLRSNQSAFTEIYNANSWGSNESASGDGSTFEGASAIREVLPKLLIELKARSLLDMGCGDFNWMRTIDLPDVSYFGVDVVKPLLERNIELYGRKDRTFLYADIAKDPLPTCDIAMCRHCLIHLPNRQVAATLKNLKTSGAKYFLTTTFPGLTVNGDIWSGSFRPINLELPPFNLPKPLRTFVDSATGDRTGVLGLWLVREFS